MGSLSNRLEAWQLRQDRFGGSRGRSGDDGNGDRDQWHGACGADGEPVRTRPRVLPAPPARIRHEAGLRRRQAHYCVGGRTAIGIEPCDPALSAERFRQQRVGLHHLCLRARSRADVDRCAEVLKEMNATIVRGPLEGSWAPGYYYVLFEDPDGIRLEVCHVPGAGLLAPGAEFDPAQGYA
ncbi:MAG TPA: VOC family protein [Stellaceae bacterium]